jgi:CxxC motif-containing protein (DUF1111 family)
MRVTIVLLLAFVGLLYLALFGPGSSAMDEANLTADFGEPVAGLSPTDRLRFEAGRREFSRRFLRSEGLGPHFNATACVSCHEDPVGGGSGPRYRDFFLVGKPAEDGALVKLYPDCTAENDAEGDAELCLPSIVIPTYGPRGTVAAPVPPDVEHPRIPATAEVVARRNTPPVFGLGLFSLISDDEILSRADPDDVDQDGISGRVNVLPNEEGAIGRFGFKCQTSSIEGFTRGALMNQMGITSDSLELLFAADTSSWLHHSPLAIKEAHAQAAEPRDSNFDFDGIRDPEISRGRLQNLVFFSENLAAPPRRLSSEASESGAAVFSEIGCNACHVASLETSRGMIHPYSDLLLHDMGPLLADGVVMGDAQGHEFRTQPLWGVCQHPPFLHDGRADTIEEAILLHGGEAQPARDRYAGLSPAEKSDLRSFLESL